MRKASKVFLCILIMLLVIFPLTRHPSAAAEGYEGNIYYNRTWDEILPSGAQMYEPTAGGAALASDKGGALYEVRTETNGNRYFAIEQVTAGNDPFFQLPIATDKHGDTQIVVELSLYLGGEDFPSASGNLLYFKNENDVAVSKGALAVQGNSITCNGNIITTVTEAGWVHFRLHLDSAAKTVSAYVNDECQYSGAFTYPSGAAESSYFSLLRVNMPNASAAGTVIRFDNLRVYASTEKQDIGTAPGLMIDPLNAVLMKVNVPRANIHGVRDVIAQNSQGEAVGAPIRDAAGRIYIPLAYTAGVFGFSTEVTGDTTMTLTANGNTYHLKAGEGSVAVPAQGRLDTALIPLDGSDGHSTEGVIYEKMALVAPPIVSDGLMMIGLCDLETLTGLHTAYDKMGLIAVSKQTVQFDRAELDTLVRLMNILTFEQPTGEQVLADMEDFGTLGAHPRLQADAGTFTALRAAWALTPEDADYDDTLHTWINKYVRQADQYIQKYFTQNTETGVWEWQSGKYFYQPYFVHKDTDGDGALEMQEGVDGTDPYGHTVSTSWSGYGDGYDAGGRSSGNTYTAYLKALGFAYQITGEEKYVRCFALGARAMGEWVHWGEGHFLNNADTAVLYATGYDWAWEGLTEVEREEFAQILFERAIFPGYAQFYQVYTYVSRRAGAPQFATATNNWMTVCSSGLWTSCLAIAEYADEGHTYTYQPHSYTLNDATVVTAKGGEKFAGRTFTYREVITDAIDNMVKKIPNCLQVYAPDGCYVESPGYWGYGTNTFFVMIENLRSATGKDYGYMSTYGLDRTCYFALNIESSDGKYWNYHDAGYGSIDSSHFSFAGRFYGDSDLVTLRYRQIAAGKSVAYEDILYYDSAAMGSEVGQMPKDYYCEGIDTYVTRSSWERGAIYAGLHAGESIVSHGNMDTGAFILYRGSTQWIMDLGSDNYNLPNYFTSSSAAPTAKSQIYRYNYYRLNPEGANTVLLAGKDDLPHGQAMGDAAATTVATGTDPQDRGTYSVIDMTEIFGGYATSAKRGMLFTNNRTTLVIQDEIALQEAGTLYWFAHTPASIEISEDGRCAYLRQGNQTLRATLLSEDETLTFQVMDTYTFVTPGTADAQWISERCGSKGAQKENDRSSIRKLAVCAENVTQLRMAVVFEFVGLETEETGYTYTALENWTSSEANVIREGTEIRHINIARAIEQFRAECAAAEGAADYAAALSFLRTYLAEPENAKAMTRALKEEADAAIAEATTLYIGAVIGEATGHTDTTRLPFDNGIKPTANLAQKTRTPVTVVQDPESGNYYLKMQFDPNITNYDKADTDSYLKIGGIADGGDYVVEFDIASFEAFPSSVGLYLRYANSSSYATRNFDISNGTIRFGSYGTATTFTADYSCGMTLGEWTHIAVVMRQGERKVDLYINGQLAVAGADSYPVNTDVYGSTFELRLVYGGSNAGDMCIDNFRFYNGTAPVADPEVTYYDLLRTLCEEELTASRAQALLDAIQTLDNTGKVTHSTEHYTFGSAKIQTRAAELEKVLAFRAALDQAANTSSAHATRYEALQSALSLLPALPPESSGIYDIRFAAVDTENAIEGLTFSAVRYNLTLYSDFRINYYIPVWAEITALRQTEDGENLLPSLPKVTVDGIEYYRYTVERDSDKTDEVAAFYVEADYGEASRIRLYSSSVIAYAEAVIQLADATAKERQLMYSIFDYSYAAACLFATETNTETVQTLAALRETYRAYATEYAQDATIYDNDAVLSTALLYAQLNLDAQPDFVFRVKDTFAGEIALSYTNCDGQIVRVTHQVTGGETLRIETMRVFEFGADIRIDMTPAGGETVTGYYNLATYRSTASGDTAAVCDALNRYIRAAQAYREESNG